MNLELSKREYSVSTFSTTCLPNEHTFVEHVITMFSLLSYLQIKKKDFFLSVPKIRKKRKKIDPE